MTKQVGSIVLGVSVVAFCVTISLMGPFSSDKGGAAKGPGPSSISGNVTVVDAGIKEKPNIIWIVVDAVRADGLSSYGYYRETTPNIDRIANEGWLFEKAISAGTCSITSYPSMFTGMFPSKHGCRGLRGWLKQDFHTIAEILRLCGYKTFAYSNNAWVAPRTNTHRGFDVFEWTPYGRIEPEQGLTRFLKIRELIRDMRSAVLEDDGARRTNDMIKQWIADARHEGKPFFIFAAYMEVHAPYHPPKSYVIDYLPENVDLQEAMSVNQSQHAYVSGRVQHDDEDFAILRALYDGELRYIDFRLGQLFDYLRDLGILDNTIVIITADHGEAFGEHQMMGHGNNIYNTMLHVPLIIRYPGVFDGGLRVEGLVQTTDIFPTLLDILDIEYDDKSQIQGHSLIGTEQQVEPRFAIAEGWIHEGHFRLWREENPQFDRWTEPFSLKAILTEEYKYIWASNGHDELYDLRKDPGEMNNLIEVEPEKASELRAQLDEWLSSFEPCP